MTAANLQDAILNHLAKCRAHKATGNVDGEDSVSSIMDSLRRAGWKGLGRNGDFEHTAKTLGFTLRRTYKGVNVIRTYISL